MGFLSQRGHPLYSPLKVTQSFTVVFNYFGRKLTRDNLKIKHVKFKAEGLQEPCFIHTSIFCYRTEDLRKVVDEAIGQVTWVLAVYPVKDIESNINPPPPQKKN